MSDDAFNAPVVSKTNLAGVKQNTQRKQEQNESKSVSLAAERTQDKRIQFLDTFTLNWNKAHSDKQINFTKEQKDILLNDPLINSALCKHDWSVVERRIKELAFWQKDAKDNALKVLKSFWDSDTHKEMQSEYRKEKFALLVLEYVRTSNKNRDDPALKEMERWIRESTRQMTASEIKEAGVNIVSTAAKEKLDISCIANLGIKPLNDSILETLDFIAGGGKIASSLTQGMGIDMMITGDAARLMREAFESSVKKDEGEQAGGGPEEKTEEQEKAGKKEGGGKSKKLKLVPIPNRESS